MQQWELLITDGHGWASRWRRVAPLLVAGAIVSGAGGFWLLSSAPSVAVAKAAANPGAAQVASAWLAWIKTGEPRQALPADSLPPWSETPRLLQAIKSDLNAGGQLTTVQHETVPAAELFAPAPGLRVATAGDVAVFTALTQRGGFMVRWTAVARRFNSNTWAVAEVGGRDGADPSRIAVTIREVLAAAGKEPKELTK